MSPPSAPYPLGTDMLGRDMLSRGMYGSRVALCVGVFALVPAIVVGVPLGGIAGFYGGAVDNIIMRLMDILPAFPIFLLAIVIMVILEPSTLNVVIALGIVRIPILRGNRPGRGGGHLYPALIKNQMAKIGVDAKITLLDDPALEELVHQ